MSRMVKRLIRNTKEFGYIFKNSKLPLFKRIIEAIYLSDIMDPIFSKYYACRGFVKDVIKVIEFLPQVWKFKDWDYAYVLEFNQYLFKRLYKGCYTEGHHIVPKNRKRALKTIIALYGRLSDSYKYTEAHSEYHDKKWGRDMENIFTLKKEVDEHGRTYTRLHDPLKDRLTEAEYAQYTKERQALYKFESYLYKQDLNLLFKLLDKHLEHFSD